MAGTDVLLDGFGRVRDLVHEVVTGLGPDELVFRVDARANSIAWLVWHLTRVQDDHVAEVADREQVWADRGWVERFGLPLSALDTGFGHTPEEVAAVRVTSPELLTGYHDEVHERTVDYVGSLGDADLDRIIDSSWDPPVSLGVRLLSVVADSLEHVGQAAFIRGVTERA